MDSVRAEELAREEGEEDVVLEVGEDVRGETSKESSDRETSTLRQERKSDPLTIRSPRSLGGHDLATLLLEVVERRKKEKDFVFSPLALGKDALGRWWLHGALGAAVFLFVDFGVCLGASGEESCVAAAVEGVLVLASLLALGVVNTVCLYRLREEKYVRVEKIVHALEVSPPVYRVNWNELRAFDSQLPSLIFAFRNGEWLPVPANMLVQGDVVALECGSFAPAFIQLVHDGSEMVEFKRGEVIDKSVIDGHCRGFNPFRSFGETLKLEELVEAAGANGIQIFSVCETPLLQVVDEFLSEANAKFSRKVPRLLETQRQYAERYFRIVIVGFLAVSFFLNMFQYIFQAQGRTWAFMFLARQSFVIIAALPLMVPIWEQTLELWGTAKLLALSEKLQGLKSSVSRISARVDKDERRRLKEDIGNRAQRDVSTGRVAAIYFRLLLDSRETQRSFRRKYADGENVEPFRMVNLLGIPLKCDTILETLAATTTLCTLDEQTVLAPLPGIEEITLLSGEKRATVLDLCSGPSNSLYFENPTWKTHLPSLKPLALASSLGTNPRFVEVGSTLSQSWFRPNEPDTGVPNASQLISLLNERPVPVHFGNLAHAIGFRPRDVRHYNPCAMIRILDNPSHPIPTPRSVISWSFHRGRSQMISLVVEDDHGRAVVPRKKKKKTSQRKREKRNNNLSQSMKNQAALINPVDPSEAVKEPVETETDVQHSEARFEYVHRSHSHHHHHHHHHHYHHHKDRERESLNDQRRHSRQQKRHRSMSPTEESFSNFEEKNADTVFQTGSTIHDGYSRAFSDELLDQKSPSPDQSLPRITKRLSAPVSPRNSDLRRSPKKSKHRKRHTGSISDGHLTQSQKESRRSLHLLSFGDPSLVTSCCTDYWSGESIWPLRSEDRDSMLSIDQRWAKEEFDGTAFAYTPIPSQYTYLFPTVGRNNAVVPTDIYLTSAFSSAPSETEGKELHEDVFKKPQTPPTEKIEHSRSQTHSHHSHHSHRQRSQSSHHPRNQQSGSSGIRSKEHESIRKKLLQDLIPSQVFTGMVGSREQPRPSLSGLIEDLHAAGVRFVYFSPRNPRRSLVLADKMGLETNWNTAISLKKADLPDLSSPKHIGNQNDELRTHWDEKAKLPHGIEQIRTHIEEVDDVPLRVSTFTDSTPAASKDMIEIHQSHGSKVTVVGTGLRWENRECFKQADLGISLQSKVFMRSGKARLSSNSIKQQQNKKQPHSLLTFPSSFREKEGENDVALPALLQIELSATLSSLHSSLVLESDASLSIVGDIIGESRLLLSNYRQSVLFVLGCQLVLACTIVIGYIFVIPEILNGIHLTWFLWIQLPILALPFISTRLRRSFMTELPPKKEPYYDRYLQGVVHRYVWCTALQLFPTSLVLAFQYMYTLAHMMPDPTAAWDDFFWAKNPTYTMADMETEKAVTQASTMFSLVWFFMWFAITTFSRLESLVFEPPTNYHWWFAAFCSLCLQIAYNEVFLTITARGNSFKWLVQPTYVYWLLFGLWPLGMVSISELCKFQDRKAHLVYQKRLRIVFETRLGMHSPK